MAEQNMQDDPQQELLRVCRIGRAQGMKGEVTVQIFTDDPEWRFAPGSVLFALDEDGGISREFEVASSRTFKSRWIVRFEGYDNRDVSEALSGTVLYGEPDDPEDMLEADEWYPRDLIGLAAVLAADSPYVQAEEAANVGTVVDVIPGAAQDLLKIRLTEPVQTGVDKDGEPVIEKTALIPFVTDIVPDIDLDARTLTLDPPGGLIPGLG